MMSSVNLLLSLINDIIDYQNFESDTFEILAEKFSLNNFLKEINDTF